ncbi:hypothetical protein [uncultured Roseibium sp.]|uniref:hypothetical protein n=1 Tax=uncultured Roseibium sp. TaxID=1936171 RepID=UPI003217A1A4
MASGTAISLGIVTQANAYTPIWSATGLYEQIVAADCRDCEEDIGILIACTGNGLPARVTVNAVAAPTGQDGAFSPVTFSIDGQTFTYQAKTVEYGLIGFTPEFMVGDSDPLIQALQSGREAFVVFNGQQSRIGLKGSRSALNIFKAHCGWTPQGYQQNLARAGAASPPVRDDVPVIPTPQTRQQAPDAGQPQTGVPPYSQTVLAPTPAQADANGAFWFTGDGFGNGSPKSLRYGIPETDAMAFYASCEEAGPQGTAVELYTSFGDLPPGSSVTIAFTHAFGSSSYKGTTFIENDEYAGSRFTIPKSDPVWSAIAASPQFSVGVAGQPEARLNGASGSAAIIEFSKQCNR